VKENQFSKHDNRHAFQSSGCYFGQGLGKKLEKDSSKNQHRSENNTMWQDNPSCYVSVYRDSYNHSNSPTGGRIDNRHRRCSSVNCTPVSTIHVCKHSTFRADPELLSKFQTVTKGSFRRFPRSHSLPHKTITVRPSECTKWWYRSPPRKTEQVGEGSSANADSLAMTGKPARKEAAYVTPLFVLAATQQPFLKRNPWTYAYKK
jgi:hypothetical protein